MIQVYTGSGKGKTTAAIGQAIRAAGNKMRTYFARFIKTYNYTKTLKLFPKIIKLKQYDFRGIWYCCFRWGTRINLFSTNWLG